MHCMYVLVMSRTRFRVNPHSIEWILYRVNTIWPNGWVFVYKLSASNFESSCSHLTFRFRACFEQEVSWDLGNYIYRVRIHSETRTWHDKNIQLKLPMWNSILWRYRHFGGVYEVKGTNITRMLNGWRVLRRS